MSKNLTAEVVVMLLRSLQPVAVCYDHTWEYNSYGEYVRVEDVEALIKQIQEVGSGKEVH